MSYDLWPPNLYYKNGAAFVEFVRHGEEVKYNHIENIAIRRYVADR